MFAGYAHCDVHAVSNIVSNFTSYNFRKTRVFSFLLYGIIEECKAEYEKII